MTTKTAAEKPATAEDIQAWLVTYISSVIDVPQDPFPVEERFDRYGLDSVEMTIMCGMLEEAYGVEVNPTEVIDNPNVKALSAHLFDRLSSDAA
ncbi:acyl carrier protein [Marinibacterium sp. SX1]|uniref:acyl carrier protein n=1 Tax=Marinibacterium sp. SX1 TaxID=3388424 RepID=UPI003D171D18